MERTLDPDTRAARAALLRDDNDGRARALAALAGALDCYRSALTTTLEQVRALLAADAAGAAGQLEQLRGELGAFAATHIDPTRFSAMLAGERVLGAEARQCIERARDVLADAADQLERSTVVEVEAGGSLRDVVANALARVGRAFGAALAVQFAKTGRYRPEEHDAAMEGFPFARWNRAERRLAPPLVVSVDGKDLHAGALAEFIDGGVKLVLLVRGACAPASLVRLVTPGTLVLQTNDVADVARLAAFEGPAVAAVVPDGAARFVHDPAAGREPWQRLVVTSVPQSAPTKPLGGISAWQQREELRQLVALSTRPSLPAATMESLVASATAGVAAGTAANGAGNDAGITSGPTQNVLSPTDPVERLTAWLLAQADLAAVK